MRRVSVTRIRCRTTKTKIPQGIIASSLLVPLFVCFSPCPAFAIPRLSRCKMQGQGGGGGGRDQGRGYLTFHDFWVIL